MNNVVRLSKLPRPSGGSEIDWLSPSDWLDTIEAEVREARMVLDAAHELTGRERADMEYEAHVLARHIQETAGELRKCLEAHLPPLSYGARYVLNHGCLPPK